MYLVVIYTYIVFLLLYIGIFDMHDICKASITAAMTPVIAHIGCMAQGCKISAKTTWLNSIPA